MIILEGGTIVNKSKHVQEIESQLVLANRNVLTMLSELPTQLKKNYGYKPQWIEEKLKLFCKNTVTFICEVQFVKPKEGSAQLVNSLLIHMILIL